jgi:hypothetical protein
VIDPTRIESREGDSSSLSRAAEPEFHLSLGCSGEPGGARVASPGRAVPYIAERLDLIASQEFGSVEAALEWCGLELDWVHLQARPGMSTMIGSKSGRCIGVIRGPLLALLPETVRMEVIR